LRFVAGTGIEPVTS